MLEPYVRHGKCSSGEPADNISRGPIIFVTPIALELLKLGPNSKRGKCSEDHCGFF